MPEEIANAAGKNQVKNADLIGTGPYKPVEHLPDRYVRAVRFDNYARGLALACWRRSDKEGGQTSSL